MKYFCRCLLFSLLTLLMLPLGVARAYTAQSQLNSHPESHKKNKPKHEKKPKVRRTKTILKGRHGKHARKPA